MCQHSFQNYFKQHSENKVGALQISSSLPLITSISSMTDRYFFYIKKKRDKRYKKEQTKIICQTSVQQDIHYYEVSNKIVGWVLHVFLPGSCLWQHALGRSPLSEAAQHPAWSPFQ